MDKTKKAKLEKAGFHIGTADEFLELTPEESAYLDLMFKLAKNLSSRRKKLGMTQAQLATLLGTNQSRVARMEGPAPDVSADLIIKALMSLGTSMQELGRMIGAKEKTPALTKTV